MVGMKSLWRAVVIIIGLWLAACAPPAPTGAPELIARVVYVAASGETVSAEYFSDERVQLQFADGRRRQLPLAVSASGARYALGDEEWWEHQGEARYFVRDQVMFVGRPQTGAGHGSAGPASP